MRAGLDVGGAKLEAVILDEAGRVRARQRAPTPDSYAAALEAIGDLLAEVERQAGSVARTLGAGIPGSLSPHSGLVRNANSQWLNGRAFPIDLARRLARPVRVENDANCFALSEATDGAGAGAHSVFGVILGTGCGGGLIVNGRVVAGHNRIAGEWGHVPLPWPRQDETPAPVCWCGRAGCLELWISGSGFRRWAGFSTEEAAARADPDGAGALALLYDRIARGLAIVIDIFDPEAIVFGGGLSNLCSICPAVEALLPRYVFSDCFSTRLARNRHGDSSGVRGAAWLFTPEEAA